MNADQALRELLAGNHRFAIGNRLTPRRSPEEFRVLAHGQFPEAVIVSCADSRVAPEILFDVGVGDIFVVRVAGNVIGGAGVTVKGSIEYAVAELNVPLILVLGHSGCGAVKAAINTSMTEIPYQAPSMAWWSSSNLPWQEAKECPATRWKTRSAKTSRSESRGSEGLEPILAPRVKDGKVKVVGGVYQLHDGSVTLIDTKKISHA